MRTALQVTGLLLLSCFSPLASAAACTRPISKSLLGEIQTLISPGFKDGSLNPTITNSTSTSLQNLDQAVKTAAGIKVKRSELQKRQPSVQSIECTTEERCLSTTSLIGCWNIHIYTLRDQYGNTFDFRNGNIRLFDGTSYIASGNSPVAVADLTKWAQARPKGFWSTAGTGAGTPVLTTQVATMTFTGANGVKATTTMLMTGTVTPGVTGVGKKSAGVRNGDDAKVLAMVAAVFGAFLVGVML